ncbi:hypothetical protein GJ699_02565 [Duganella sp. FT80W]|uniref:Right handed beta helix domain-containing protein n=1 Tax=Duganella guangzhouensis TaxID=2666084 RepID=A0A6I2KTD3_9BURK|nr:hypothetical protein [Duganella guangzhouensis]MRW88861.1 hypothetical protein [Duganella guangzhouensis]
MSQTTTINAGELGKTITLQEGKALTITGSAGAAGMAYLLDPALGGTNSSKSWVIGTGPLPPIGSFNGAQKVLVTCTVGSIDAVVGDAVLVMPQLDTAGGALIDTIGNRRTLGEAYSPQSKRLPMFYVRTRKELKSATFTHTNTPTAAPTEIYIDFNRGLDTNPGTRYSPKKNPSSISGQSIGGNSLILFATDSLWDIVATSAASNIIDVQNMKGTSGNRLYIGAYDPAGHTGLKPTFTYGYEPAAGDWVWSATYNAWELTIATASPQQDMACFFGTAKIAGTNAWQGNHPPLFGDLQYGFITGSPGKLYVWAPSTQNPTSYYGKVRTCPNTRGLFHNVWQGLQYTTIENLHFQDMAAGISNNVSSGAGAHVGLDVRNCEVDRGQLLGWFSGSAGAHSFTASNNIGRDCGSSLIKASQNSNGGTHTYDMSYNKIYGCNKQQSAHGGFYFQLVSAALGDGRIHHNYIRDAWNGTGTELNNSAQGAGSGYGSPFDGCGVYFDVTSDKCVAYANIVEHSHVGLQANSAKQMQFLSNITIDCNVHCTVTDDGTGGNDVVVAHGTYINNLVDTNQLKRGTTSDPRRGISVWFKPATAGSVRVFNNALHRTASVAGQPAIRIEADSPTKYCAGNAISGWSDAAKVQEISLTGTNPTLDLTATAAVLTSGGATWFDGATAVPIAGGPLVNAGVRHIDGLYDVTGTAYERLPTIGAVEYTAS